MTYRPTFYGDAGKSQSITQYLQKHKHAGTLKRDEAFYALYRELYGGETPYVAKTTRIGIDSFDWPAQAGFTVLKPESGPNAGLSDRGIPWDSASKKIEDVVETSAGFDKLQEVLDVYRSGTITDSRGAVIPFPGFIDYHTAISLGRAKGAVSAFKPTFTRESAYRPMFVATLPMENGVSPSDNVGCSDFADQLRSLVVKLSNAYALSNGSPVGMWNRLVKVNRVARLAKSYQSAITIIEEEDLDIFEVLQDKLGFGRAELPLNDPLDLLNAQWSEWYRINAKSDSGYPFLGPKREATVVPDLFATYQTVINLSQISTETEFFALTRNLKKFCVTKSKPKFEITTAEKVTESTRIIKVMPAWLQATVGAVTTASMASNHEPLIGHDKDGNFGVPTQSLGGFSPYHGGLHKILGTMIERSRAGTVMFDKQTRVYWAFYSDNVFAAVTDANGAPSFHSLDASKMEASSDLKEARVAMDYMLKSCHNLSGGYLAKYIRFCGADLSHDQVSVVGNSVYTQPGLGSGAQTTFWINHARMAMITEVLEIRKVNPLELSQGETLSTQVGKVVLQKETSDTEAALTPPSNPAYLLAVHKPDYISIDEVIRSKDPDTYRGHAFPPVIRLDLLGHDARPYYDSKKNEYVMCACLTFERLMRALPYCSQNPEDAPLKTTKAFIVVVTLINYYLIGGYAYKDAHCLINMTIAHLFQSNRDEWLAMINTPGRVEAVVSEIAENEFPQAQADLQAQNRNAISGLVKQAVDRMSAWSGGLGENQALLSPSWAIESLHLPN